MPRADSVQPFVRALAQMGKQRMVCYPRTGTRAFLIDLDVVDWDQLDLISDDAGFYSKYISAIIFEEIGQSNVLGCEFFSTMDETWEAWEQLLDEASKRD